MQVFKRLDTEFFKNAGSFRSPEAAKSYLENASKNQYVNLKRKIVGAGQEVDWTRVKQGELQSLFEGNSLLTGNAPGADGFTISRISDKQIARVTIKGASTEGGLRTGSKGIRQALKKGLLEPDDTVIAPKGMKSRLLKDLQREIDRATATGDTKTAELLRKALKSKSAEA